ncbi:MAG TPA: NlpC/P60 family protein [Marinobacter sp.]|nr:NlpC/P60 family protein [Marinobacter sp.]
MTWRLLLPLFMITILFGLGGCASNQDLGTSYNSRWQPSERPVTDGELAAAQQLWQVFERYEGTPYRYGGTSASGFDCSGFISTAFHEAVGRRLPRTTHQMLAAGERVPLDSLRSGDLVFFNIKGKDQHAGIYMGDDSFIHASTSSGVMRSSLNGYYWRNRISQARRFY